MKRLGNITSDWIHLYSILLLSGEMGRRNWRGNLEDAEDLLDVEGFVDGWLVF